MPTKRRRALQVRSRSDLVVDDLILRRPGVRRAGFAKAVLDRFQCEDLYACAKVVVPDAYEFHEDECILTLIEVVDTNWIKPAKASRIARLSYGIDDQEWELEVVVLDPCGNIIGAACGWAFDEMFAKSYRNGRESEDTLPSARALMHDLRASNEQPLTRAEMEHAINLLE